MRKISKFLWLYLTNVIVQNSVAHTESAWWMFELMPERDLVAWKCVINLLAMNERPNEGLILFRDTSFEGVNPYGFIKTSLLSACVELGALALGRYLC